MTTFTLSVASLAWGDSKSLAYGKYLAVEVAQCQNCHTPVTERGEMDKTQWMKGMVLNIQPIQPVKDWHKTAPDITPSGKLWKKWGDEAMLKYFMTGLKPDGKLAGPPMPAYKLPQKDAEALFEYLKSLQ